MALFLLKLFDSGVSLQATKQELESHWWALVRISGAEAGEAGEAGEGQILGQLSLYSFLQGAGNL